MPFLENVTRGRNVPRERLEEVAHHYMRFGGVSPINAQNRELIAALERELAEHGIDLPVYFGNRNWHPLLPDTVAQMTRDGVRRALCFLTSAFSSYSGCRQYRENLFVAQLAVGPDAPELPRLRMLFNHPGFIEANADRLRAALAESAGRAARRLHRAQHPGRDGRAVRATRRSSPRRRGSSPRRPASATTRSSTRAAAGRRTCRGSSRTSSTTCATCTRAA